MRGRSASSVFANPVLVGAVTVLVVIVAVFLSYNANNGLPFVPDDVAEGALRQRPEPRQGQRDPLRRLPHRRRRGHEARAAVRRAGRRRAQAQARQVDREDPRGLALAHPPALRARPEVPRAHRGRLEDGVHATATRSRSSRPRSTSTSTRSSRCSTRRPARASQRATCGASATRSPAAAPPSGARSRRRRACSATSSRSRATSPTRRHAAARLLQGARRRRAHRRADLEDERAPVHDDGRHLGGGRPRPGGAAPVHLQAAARRWTPAISSFRVQRPFLAELTAFSDGLLRRDAASCAARCRTSTRRSRPARASSAACPSSTRSSRARSPRSRT